MMRPGDWESNFLPFYDTRIETPAELGSLLPMYDVLGELEQHPTGNDLRIRAYAEGMRRLMLLDSRLRMTLGFMHDFRGERDRDTPPLYAANLFLRAAQHLLKNRPDYAELSNTPEGWIAGVTSILDDPKVHEALDMILALGEVRTNVPGREMGPQLWLSLYGERFDHPIRLLDVGPSVGAGVKGFIAGKINHPVRVHQVIGGEVPGSAHLFDHQSVSDYINEQNARKLEFGQCFGADLMGQDFAIEPENLPQDRLFGNADWVESNFYPTELIEDKGGVVSEFRRFNQLRLPNYKQYQLDFSSNDEVAQFDKNRGGEKFDVVTILTMLNQLSEAERVRVIANAKKMVEPKDSEDLEKPGGFVIVQDFCRVNPAYPSGLEFYPLWNPYTYRTIIFDMASPDQRPVEVFWWRNGRCTDVIIAPTGQFFTQNLPTEL